VLWPAIKGYMRKWGSNIRGLFISGFSDADNELMHRSDVYIFVRRSFFIMGNPRQEVNLQLATKY
jgi:hypothetical protein